MKERASKSRPEDLYCSECLEPIPEDVGFSEEFDGTEKVVICFRCSDMRGEGIGA